MLYDSLNWAFRLPAVWWLEFWDLWRTHPSDNALRNLCNTVAKNLNNSKSNKLNETNHSHKSVQGYWNAMSSSSGNKLCSLQNNPIELTLLLLNKLRYCFMNWLVSTLFRLIDTYLSLSGRWCSWLKPRTCINSCITSPGLEYKIHLSSRLTVCLRPILPTKLQQL